MTFIVLESMESLRSFQKVMQLLERATEWEQESPVAPERLEIFRDLSPFMHVE